MMTHATAPGGPHKAPTAALSLWRQRDKWMATPRSVRSNCFPATKTETIPQISPITMGQWSNFQEDSKCYWAPVNERVASMIERYTPAQGSTFSTWFAWPNLAGNALTNGMLRRTEKLIAKAERISNVTFDRAIQKEKMHGYVYYT